MIAVDCTLCENDYGRYAVPLSSRRRPAAQAVLRGDVWERQTIEFMSANAGNRDIVHAGTYFGDFLPGLSSAMSGGKTIYAFEPNPENFNCAEWTKLLNSLKNVNLQETALGGFNSKRYMQIAQSGEALGGASRIVHNSFMSEDRSEDFEDISTVRLDDVLPSDSDIGILQLDVEGFEKAALEGGLSTIARCRPILILESVPYELLKSDLIPLGYQQVGAVCGNTIFGV
jgi:FkbM family methyltransferase